MTKYYETLCSNHDDIIFKVQQLEKYLKDNILILDQPWVKHIFDTTRDIKAQVKHCKKQGQRMENRLRKYRRAVERLGFKREV